MNSAGWPSRHGSCLASPMRRSPILTLVLPLLWMTPAQGQGAVGPDHIGTDASWRYCLAVSETTDTVYLSAPLLTATPLDTLERKFDRLIGQTVADHRPSLCPRASSAEEAETLRGVAIRYNQGLGHAARFIAWREDERGP